MVKNFDFSKTWLSQFLKKFEVQNHFSVLKRLMQIISNKLHETKHKLLNVSLTKTTLERKDFYLTEFLFLKLFQQLNFRGIKA